MYYAIYYFWLKEYKKNNAFLKRFREKSISQRLIFIFLMFCYFSIIGLLIGGLFNKIILYIGFGLSIFSLIISYPLMDLITPYSNSAFTLAEEINKKTLMMLKTYQMDQKEKVEKLLLWLKDKLIEKKLIQDKTNQKIDKWSFALFIPAILSLISISVSNEDNTLAIGFLIFVGMIYMIFTMLKLIFKNPQYYDIKFFEIFYSQIKELIDFNMCN